MRSFNCASLRRSWRPTTRADPSPGERACCAPWPTSSKHDATHLVEIAQSRDCTHPDARLEGEVRRTAFQFRFFADVVLDGSFLHASIDHATDSPMGPLPDLRRCACPLGPVAVFGSSNFPFAFSVPGGDTASALAAGCPVVIKAHPAHPATSLATFEALQRAARDFEVSRRSARVGLWV